MSVRLSVLPSVCPFEIACPEHTFTPLGLILLIVHPQRVHLGKECAVTFNQFLRSKVKVIAESRIELLLETNLLSFFRESKYSVNIRSTSSYQKDVRE